MINELEEAIKEVLDGLDETDEFKRKFEAYIRNSLSSTAAPSDLESVISAITMEVDDEA